MYDSSSELLAEIAGGEDSFIEFKEIVAEGPKLVLAGRGGRAMEWIARQLCGFANSEGGVVVFGVNDERTVVGVPDVLMDRLQLLVAEAGRSGCEPPLDHLLLMDAMALAGGRTLLKVEIRPDYTTVHAPRGKRPVQRIGSSTREVTMEALPRLLARRGSLTAVDERPLLTAVPTDLDRTQVAGFFERRFGQSDPATERQLRSLRLVAEDELGQVHPSVAGLLMFGRTPSEHLGGAYVDLVVYDSRHPDADRQLDAKAFRGTIVEQIEDCTNYFATSPAVATAATKDGSGRLDSPAYSLRALQEAVVNAVVHRDYQLTGSQVRVFILADRIEVSSPGRLPNSLSVEDLFQGAVPFRRNQVLAGLLAHFVSPVTGRAYMESRGEGFLTMVRETEALSGRRPELQLQTEGVTVVLFSAHRREEDDPRR